jgi:hypothetical protein
MAFFLGTLWTFAVGLLFAWICWRSLLQGRIATIGATRQHEPVTFWLCIVLLGTAAVVPLAFAALRAWALAYSLAATEGPLS